MGLFSKEPCSLCGDPKGQKLFSIKDGRLCTKCYNKFNIFIPDFIKSMPKLNKSDLLRYDEIETTNKELNRMFKTSKRIDNCIEFDVEKKQFRIFPKIGKQKLTPAVYNCDDIIEFELLEDGITVTSGGLGRAAAGGILLGGVGAIVGGVTGKKKSRSVIENFKIKLILNDFQNPTVYIELLEKKKVKTDSKEYKEMYDTAQEILSTLAVLQKNKDNELAIDKEKTQASSVVEQIREFKGLFDEGIITEDEFNVKKKELLEI